MKFILLENIFLYEDIESMKKYYPNIEDDMFMQYIELDPTYKQGSTSAGKYAKWILNLADKGRLENIGHVKDILMRFEEEKKNLVNKDIMKYKSMEDLENALSAQSNKLELSDRQKERRMRNDYQDAELIAEDDNWEVWIPHSYNASCTLGKGTEWCTAYSRDDRYYKRYTSSGDLIIFINKKDPTEKYQLHKKTDSFMNKEDHPADFISFLQERLSSLIQDVLIKKYPSLKKFIDFDGTWVYDKKNHTIPKQSRSKIKKIIISNDITRIGNYAFWDCHNLMSIIIPNSVTSIEEWTFAGCSSLTSITFQGTKAQWNAVRKGYYWDFNTGDYTVHCTDGDISKHTSALESLKNAPIQNTSKLVEIYPDKGESKKDFISRFMSVTKGEYPDIKQRYAVANSYWDRRKKVKEDFEVLPQEYTSANTSINSSKLPTIFHLVTFKPETINLDYGGGKFDNATDYLSSFNVTNLIYDPFNRSAEHNKKVLATINQNGGTDTATCSNVLNVIKEPEVRKSVIKHIESLLKPSGVAYFTVYEGTKERDEHPTKAGYQLNRPTSDYVQEIASVFNNVMRKGKLIIARN